MRERVAMLDYANRHQISIEQVKAKLAGDAMKLQVQKELSGLDRGHDRDMGERDKGHERVMAHTNAALKPPTEPAGRARNGRSFEQ